MLYYSWLVYCYCTFICICCCLRGHLLFYCLPCYIWLTTTFIVVLWHFTPTLFPFYILVFIWITRSIPVAFVALLRCCTCGVGWWPLCPILFDVVTACAPVGYPDWFPVLPVGFHLLFTHLLLRRRWWWCSFGDDVWRQLIINWWWQMMIWTHRLRCCCCCWLLFVFARACCRVSVVYRYSIIY